MSEGKEKQWGDEWLLVLVSVVVGGLLMWGMFVSSMSDIGIASDLCDRMYDSKPWSWYVAKEVVVEEGIRGSIIAEKQVLVTCVEQNITSVSVVW